MKQFFKWIVCGMAVTLGGIIVNSVVGVWQDPTKKSKIKRKFEKVTNAFKED